MMFQKMAVHGFPKHHLLVKLDQKLLSLFAAHVTYLCFEGTQAKLLLQRQFCWLAHDFDSSVSKGDLKVNTWINQICKLFQRSTVGFGMPDGHLALVYITKGNNCLTKSPSAPRNTLLRERDDEMPAKVPSAGIYNCI